MQAQDTQLSRGAYGSDSIIENMGTIFVIAELFVFFLLFIFAMRCLCCYLCRLEWVDKKYEGFKEAIFWGTFLRFGLQCYLEVALASQINLRLSYDTQNTVHEITSYFLAVFGAFFVLMFPFYIIVLLTNHYKKIK